MTKDKALQMCLEYIETDAHDRKYVRHAIKQALAAPVQEPVKVGRITDNIKGMVLRQEVMLYTDDYLPIGTAIYTTPPAAQRQWVGMIQGVRVEREYVVVSVHGGNRAARELCAAMIEEMNK
jgi:hypothetical protein